MFAAGRSRGIRRWIENNARFARDLFAPAFDTARVHERPLAFLLSGWALPAGTMNSMAMRLDRDGFEPHIVKPSGILGIINTSSVELSAAHLMERIAAELHRGERAAVIGHSLGGLIGRYMVCAMGGGDLVHTVITLGSPHRGSPVARAANVTPLRWISGAVPELVPDSHLMRRLARAPIPADVYFASLHSESDDMVPPPCAEMSAPAGEDNVVNISVGSLGHFELATDEGVYAMVREELRRGIERSGMR